MTLFSFIFTLCKKNVIPAVLFAVAGSTVLISYRLLKPATFNNAKPEYIYIYPHTTPNDITKRVEANASGSLFLYKRLYRYFKLDKNIPVGVYLIEPDKNVIDLLHDLRRRRQTPVKFTFNNTRTLVDVVSRADTQLLLSGDSLLAALQNPETPAQYGFTEETFPAMFIPNTYEVYWNIGVNSFLVRMKREYGLFWNQQRTEKAKKIGLSPLEVSILASIVEEESSMCDEYPVIAGLYLNRLRKNMLLQADPTVKFTVGDFTLQRILNKHLATDSPYNTYRYIGLPPGPIRIPSPQAIDGVLNAAQHNYLYMCAKEDFSGQHNFSVTLREHTQNAARYHQALNRLNIRK